MGQRAIADTLIHALQQNRIAPAYLFCGPRGTGKTSSARILSKSLNCLAVDGPTPTPCGKCDVCRAVSSGSALDIVEIDAASNTGVDNIRELIERAQFAPVQCRYKAYVIDECHMLSTAAFNALLKTLEEPPDRVVFVLATTDPQRVLPTIISRCQRFDFRRIPLSAMVKHLSYIAQQEAIEIDEAAVHLVAQIAQGGLRDAESLLDQLSLRLEQITVEAVWDLVGAVPERDLLNLVKAIAADDGTVLIDRTRNLMDKGREPLIVLQSLVGFYRDLLIAKSAPDRADMVAITPPTWAEMTAFAQKLTVSQLLASQQKLQTAEVQVKNTTQPRLWLEITLTSLLPSALGALSQLASATSPARTTVGIADRSVLTLPNPPALSSTASPTLPSPSPARSPSPAEQTTQASPARSQKPDIPTSNQETASPVSDNSEKANPGEINSGKVNPGEVNPIHPGGTHLEEKDHADLADSAVVDTPTFENSTPSSKTESSRESEVAFGTLEDLWGQILAALAPRGTQMLMNQQGSLLAFDGVSAKVGFRSAKLQKMAQDRIPNLEQALKAVFHRPIKVLLEVQQPEKSAPASTTDNKPSAPPPRPIAQRISQPAPPSQPTSSSPSAPPNINAPNINAPNINTPNINAPNTNTPNINAPNISAPDNISPTSPMSPKGESASNREAPQSAPHTDHLPSAPSTNPSPNQWVADQEQDNIKRFAQFFNGQIVNLEDDELTVEKKDSEKKSAPTNEQNKRAKKSPDPGPDVPF